MARNTQTCQKRSLTWPWIVIPLALLLLAGFIWTRLLMDTPPAAIDAPEVQAATGDAAAVASETPANQTPTNPASASQGKPAPAALATRITALGRTFDGEAGIVVQSIDDGWIASHNGDIPLPQQSLSKLWVAVTALDKADKGALSLNDSVTLTSADLSIFHQPIRKRILASGSFRTTNADLLRRAMTQSDNTANAALFRQVGGRDGVVGFLSGKGLNNIKMDESEKALQMGIVGMEWRDSYSYGRNFWKARKRVPFAQRMQKMGVYLADPPDAATPHGVAKGLQMLATGRLLSSRSSAYLIDLMAKSKTGPKRLRGGLSAGWSLPHKTGTGQVLKLLATAYNDVGILISPTGRRYAVVVMIGATNRPVPERQDLMQAVTRSVIACENAGWQSC